MDKEAKSDPTLIVDGLRKTYNNGEVIAVDNISFSVNSGSVVGILGPNGAGKTTMIKSALGLVIPDSGDIYINGDPVIGNSNKIYKHVSAVLEGARNVYWRLTVMENIRYFASLQGKNPRRNREEYEEIIELLDLKKKKDTLVKDLSRGMKQKAALACVLARQTPVMFLDEPTLGLDIETSYHLREELRRLAEKENKTIILSSHNMDVLQDICDRIIIMNEGEIITDNTIEELIDLFKAQAYEITIKDDLTPELRSTLVSSFDAGDWIDQGDQKSFRVSFPDPDRFYELMEILDKYDVTTISASSVEPDLEEIFIKITNNSTPNTASTIEGNA